MLTFATTAGLPGRTSARKGACAPICMSADGAPSQEVTLSRRALLSAAALAGAGFLIPRSANAGLGIEGAVSKVFFPKEGFNTPEKTIPGKVTLDPEVLKTPEAKEALKKLRDYSASIKDTIQKFTADPTSYDVASFFKSTLRIDDIRSSLNTVNEAFDEDTQRYTDKVVRGIIQDIGEVINSAVIKPGIPRTQKRIDRTKQWLSKIKDDFDNLLAFYKE